MSYYSRSDIQRPSNVYRVRRSSTGLNHMYQNGSYYSSPPDMRMVYQYQPTVSPQMVYRPPPVPYNAHISRPYRPVMCCDTFCDSCCDACCPSCCGPSWCCCC